VDEATLKARLAKLREEYESGMQALSDIQRRQDDLRATLLRISGAIQVLEELLGEPPPATLPASEG
jgi:hypothetical protein